MGEAMRLEIAPDLIIWQGDVRESLRQLPDDSVQTCVTSPPYFGLRDYGTADWEGGDPKCDHGVKRWDGPKQTQGAQSGHASKADRLDRRVCETCGARRVDNQIGLEPTVDAYVQTMVEVFREVRRVLRKDGVLFLNLGDSYNGSGGAGGDYAEGGLKEGQPKYPGRRIDGLKPKDLCMVPERVALALQADGWWLRAKPPWVKGNCMPESVTDRPTTAHENIFLFSKSAQYFYDVDAVRQEQVKFDLSATTFKRDNAKHSYTAPGQTMPKHRPDRPDTEAHPLGRNRRTSDWWNESLDETIANLQAYLLHLHHVRDHGGMLTDTEGMPMGFMVNTVPYKDAHFATWPPKLVEPMILASTSPQACPHCGAPWERVVEMIPADSPTSYNGSSFKKGKTAAPHDNVGQGTRYERGGTIDWRPTCSCENNDGSGKCVVLDPFNGSGTTGQVALENGRAYIGCELNPAYIEITKRRLRKGQTTLLGRL